jgi:uncharacterized glyoxalase superfamily protein PhnB
MRHLSLLLAFCFGGAGILPAVSDSHGNPVLHSAIWRGLPQFVIPSAARDLLFARTSANETTVSKEKTTMNVKRITPVLLVKEVEPLIPFWVDRLGFTKTVEVPHGAKLGFVVFQKGSAEVMYQTYGSVQEDAPKEVAATAGKGPSYLYMEVDNLDAVLAAMKDVHMVMPVRTAFYGMKEFSVQDPGGHFITFAQPVAAQH